MLMLSSAQLRKSCIFVSGYWNALYTYINTPSFGGVCLALEMEIDAGRHCIHI